ncbi:MAG: CRISPR-associated endonuclease Cas3'' [Acidilobaceae archaeon]
MSNLEWPLAYAEGSPEDHQVVSLSDHLSNTAKMAFCLFDNDLEVLSKRARVDKKTLTKTLVLSAGLHDIGKASRYYLEKWFENRRLTFPYHEFLSALILYELYQRYVDESKRERELACLFRTSAKIVSRHHSSMLNRHPSNHADMNLINGVRDATQKITSSDVMKALEQLLCNMQLLCNIWIVKDELDIIMTRVEDVISQLNKMENNDIKSIVMTIADLRSDPGDVCGNMNELVVVRTITGFLIIADNIVASYERRSTDDSPMPAYIGSWIRELERRLECCSRLLSCSENFSSFTF